MAAFNKFCFKTVKKRGRENGHLNIKLIGINDKVLRCSTTVNYGNRFTVLRKLSACKINKTLAYVTYLVIILTRMKCDTLEVYSVPLLIFLIKVKLNC